MTRFIGGTELARELGITELQLHEFANRSSLPWDFSATYGMWIERDALPAWRRAAHNDHQ
jgi:hypothetical protein